MPITAARRGWFLTAEPATTSSAFPSSRIHLLHEDPAAGQRHWTHADRSPAPFSPSRGYREIRVVGLFVVAALILAVIHREKGDDNVAWITKEEHQIRNEQGQPLEVMNRLP